MKTWFLADGGIKRRLGETVRKFAWGLLIFLNVIIAIAVGVVYSMIQDPATPTPVAATGTPSPSASTTSQPPDPEPTDSSFESIYNIHPTTTSTHWMSWALIDNKSGILVGSENWAQPSYVMSMIKPWIAADYFNQNPSPSSYALGRLGAMIQNSDDQAAYDYFGGQPSLDRLVQACGLTDMVNRGWSWSLTEMSARDAARYGHCIYSGHATSAAWTVWIVDKMRHVQGAGDFGPRELFQDRTTVATKNGWYSWDGKWYINCLAATDAWTIAIIQQWPYAGGDLEYGINIADPVCKSIANQVLRLKV